ncbi:hypothetical protein OU790_19630, partial [Ruegeria sp. NA]
TSLSKYGFDEMTCATADCPLLISIPCNYRQAGEISQEFSEPQIANLNLLSTLGVKSYGSRGIFPLTCKASRDR